MHRFDWARHTIFAAASCCWLLPGHFQLSENAAGPLDVTALLMLSIAWLVCYASDNKVSQDSQVRLQLNFTFVFLAIAAIGSAIHFSSPFDGLKGRYYANGNFQPPIESSWAFRGDEYTRIDSQLDFEPHGFSFTEQYFPLYFSNDWYRRSWKANGDNNTNGYLFSAEWNGTINLPKNVTELAIRSSAGHASLTLDGIVQLNGQTSALSGGPHELEVRYARDSKEPPSLSLQWLQNGKWMAVPSHAFSERVWAKFIPHLQLGLLSFWLATLGYLAWRLKTPAMRSFRTFLWLIFVSLFVTSVLDLADHGKSFDFQIFSPGSDWLLYETFARDILHGNWLSTQEMPFIWMNFGYRYILSLLHLLAGEAPADAILLQRFCMALLVTVAASVIAARWGAIVSITFVSLVLWSNQIKKFSEHLLDTTWALFASMLFVYGLMRYANTTSRRWLAFVGFSLGIGILIRANFLPFLAVAVLWVWFIEPKRYWQKRTIDVAILITLVVGLMSLVGIRNLLVAGEWRWLPTNAPFNLWLGNHPPEFNGPTYFGTTWTPPEPEIVKYVLNYVLSDPQAMLGRILDKSLYIFGIDRESAHNFKVGVEEGVRVKTQVLLPWLLAIFGSVSLWMRPNYLQRRELVLLWAWIGVVNLPLAVFFFPWAYGWRFSAPSFLFLYVIGAIALFQWYVAGKTLWLNKYRAKPQAS